MGNDFLYDSPYVANRIKVYAKDKNIALKDLLIACNLGSNTFSHMLHGRSMAFDSLAKIADYLDCSVDYLLGRTDVPEVNQRDNLIPIYTAARSQNGQYSRAGVEYIDKEALDRLRNAPETDEDL